MTSKPAERKRFAWIILLCFFASGASGLIYQVIWVRELVLIFGATTFAASTVLTAFMGGLALGSFYFGKRSEQVERPLRLYGFLEVGIGIYGLLIPFIFGALPSLYHPVSQQLDLSFFTLSLFRFSLVALVLMIPTALMGATLPVLASYYARGSALIGMRVGWLYSINTFGAVLGAALSGFLLMPSLGMRFTTVTAACINLLLGAVALAFSRRSVGDTPSIDPVPAKQGRSRNEEASRFSAKPVKRGRTTQPRLAEMEPVGQRAMAVVLVAFAVSGFVALSYEVIWSRILTLIIGSSVYAFSVMLTTFLIGLAIGAWLASRLVDRIKHPLFVFAAVEIGIGLSSLAGAYMFNQLPYVYVQLYRWFAASGFGLLLVARFVVASLVMLAPTVLLGALFPLVVRTVYGRGDKNRFDKVAAAAGQRSEKETLGRTVGSAYAVNTIGAIGGAFLSGFALIPLIGLLDTLRLSIGLNFIIATVLLLLASRSGKQRIAMAASMTLIVVVAATRPPWDVAVMSSAVYRYAPAMSKMNRAEFFDYFRLGNQGEAIFYDEGITATVVVQKQEGGRVLKVNGKPDASTGADLPTQVLIGTLPLIVRDKTDDVLVIGLGSGVTLGAVEQFPIKRLTCVELEPAVIEASRHFNDVNNRPLEDSRLTMIANDGRNYLDTTTEKFDVIISEPSNPWLTGVANLFTLEYFQRGAQRLKDDGVFSQWLQIYEMSPDDVKTLVATFKAAFPYVNLFRGFGSDLMLLGSKQRLAVDRATIERHLADAKIGSEHRRIQVTSPADLLSYFYFGPEGVEKFCAGAPLNTDDNALIEFRAPRRVGVPEETVEVNLREIVACAREWGHPTSNGRYGLLADDRSGRREKAEFLLDLALSSIKRDDARRAEQFVEYSIQIEETARAYSILGEVCHARGDEGGALEKWHYALALDPDHFYTVLDLGKFYLSKQDVTTATSYLERAVRLKPDSARAHHLRGLAYQAERDNERAVAEYRKALPDGEYAKSIKTFYLNFGTALLELALYEEAAQMLEEYVRGTPQDFEGQFQLGAAYEIVAEGSLDDALTERAIKQLKKALAIKPDHPMSHYYLSKAFRRLGRYEEAEAEFELYERFLAR